MYGVLDNYQLFGGEPDRWMAMDEVVLCQKMLWLNSKRRQISRKHEKEKKTMDGRVIRTIIRR